MKINSISLSLCFFCCFFQTKLFFCFSTDERNKERNKNKEKKKNKKKHTHPPNNYGFDNIITCQKFVIIESCINIIRNIEFVI